MFRKNYREFFCIKYRKTSNQRFRVQISLLILSMVMYCMALCATTFAWFTAQQDAKVDSIVSANYSVQISIDGSVIDSNEYTFNSEETNEHTVIITANGTATSGYVVIDVGGNTYSTQQIQKGDSITLTIVAAEDEVITFEAFWGEETWRQEYLKDGDTLYISGTPDTEETTETEEETEESTEGSTEETEGFTEAPTEDTMIPEEPSTESDADLNEPTEIPEESEIESGNPESTEEENPDTETYSEIKSM